VDDLEHLASHAKDVRGVSIRASAAHCAGEATRGSRLRRTQWLRISRPIRRLETVATVRGLTATAGTGPAMVGMMMGTMMEGSNTRRAAVVFAALLGVFPTRIARGDDGAAPRTTEDSPATSRQSVSRDDDEASSPATDTEPPRLNASRVAVLRRERAQIHRGGPIALLVVGGAVGVMSLSLAQMQGLSAMSDSSTPPPESSPTGFYIASGVGFTAAVIGLFWLFDCNHRRSDLEERIERLEGRAARSFVLPVVDPMTRSASVMVYQRF
jgi:hypothetical protein